MKSDQRLNPYQPPAVGSVPDEDLDAPTRVAFHLNRRLRRHAEKQYLLRLHPRLLLFSSLAMILASACVMTVSISFGIAKFLPTLICVLVTSAAVYTALVYRSERQIRVIQQAYGLTLDAVIEIVSDPQRFTLVTPAGTYQWPNHELQVYWTIQGLLICPEPVLYVFIPKSADVQLQTYRQFVKLLRSRAQPS